MWQLYFFIEYHNYVFWICILTQTSWFINKMNCILFKIKVMFWNYSKNSKPFLKEVIVGHWLYFRKISCIRKLFWHLWKQFFEWWILDRQQRIYPNRLTYFLVQFYESIASWDVRLSEWLASLFTCVFINFVIWN